MAHDRLTIVGDTFRDTAGRSVILRGVNLGGDCKLPYPDGGTNIPTDFADHREVSFIGRPFPIEEADEHLGRLSHWGFNVVRLVTTWEAVEHAGPGLYDEAYLDFLAEICRRAAKYGLYVMIDFHQDVWSRMTGGSGAPGWTFEAVGLDFTKFHAADASHVMQNLYDYERGGWQDAYPQMSWGGNHRLPPTNIMWTFFWTGRLFTPDYTIDGVNVQDFLQSHYLGAMDQVARKVAGIENVLGFDTLNEPVTGWITRRMTYRHVAPTLENALRPRLGLAMSALDCLLAARGIPVAVPLVVRDPQTGALSAPADKIVNANRISIWRDGLDCPFEAAGAYRLDGDRVAEVTDDFFQRRGGRELNAEEDAYSPLFHKVADITRAHQPAWGVFAEIEPYAAVSGEGFPAEMPERSVNASHWYDYSTLYTKRFQPEAAYDFATGETSYGRNALKQIYCEQLGRIAGHARGFGPAGAPTLIGEFGIPYDLDHGAAFAAWAAGNHGDELWAEHVAALSLMYEAMDQLQLHSTQWNYTASNRNDLMIGDGWNQEDLSIFSRDQQTDPADPDSGGRAIAGFCRPFVRRTAGRLIEMTFDIDRLIFTAEIGDLDEGNGPDFAELYVPHVHFGAAPAIEVEGADWRYARSTQLLTLAYPSAAIVRITIRAE
ncbi:cellulase family glycosylhydrolase [Sphingomonas sp. BIUV-7]|uniref:Cellulase family glycosylhydrolase n=1 Tax=Sphingomonas natans TaxID=3063330 RepID=A0ABT8Y8P9_9SPHN|nr:cellulase family glycosylhydrolase [Sphingomonas sp. BIUV-7]MDO6414706.1 cellulase family glycosylhydrolase [Sphingomonas sp. BIUV-7]